MNHARTSTATRSSRPTDAGSRFDGGYGSPDVYDAVAGAWQAGPYGPVADLLAAAPQLLAKRDEAQALVREMLDLLRPHVLEDDDTAEPAVLTAAQLAWRDRWPAWAFESAQ